MALLLQLLEHLLQENELARSSNQGASLVHSIWQFGSFQTRLREQVWMVARFRLCLGGGYFLPALLQLHDDIDQGNLRAPTLNGQGLEIPSQDVAVVLPKRKHGLSPKVLKLTSALDSIQHGQSIRSSTASTKISVKLDSCDNYRYDRHLAP